MYYRVKIKDSYRETDSLGNPLKGEIVEVVYFEGGVTVLYPHNGSGLNVGYKYIPAKDVEILEELKLIPRSKKCDKEVSAIISSYGEVTNGNNPIKNLFGHNISKITVEYK